MKKYLLTILVSFFMTIGLTGCYTEFLTTNAALTSDNPDNTIIIYYPVPVPVPAPGCPQPVQPHPVYPPITHPNGPSNPGNTKRTETKLRNDNGGRGNEQQTQRQARIESGNNTSSGAGNTSNNSPRNNNGGRNTNGGR